MAMPLSGSIGLKECVGTITCSSIACAVTGGNLGNQSLSSLSVSAGKTAPHGMREFYGYTGAATLSVIPTTLSFGFLGSSQTVTVTASAGNSWTASNGGYTWITILGGSGTGSGSFSVAVDKNNGFASRNGTVYVTSDAATVSITVFQDSEY